MYSSPIVTIPKTPIEPILIDVCQATGYAAIFAFTPEYPHSPQVQTMRLRKIRTLRDIEGLSLVSPSSLSSLKCPVSSSASVVSSHCTCILISVWSLNSNLCHYSIPDGIAGPQPNPLRNRAVLLLRSSELLFCAEGLVGLRVLLSVTESLKC